ncbi:HAD family hydrolase [Thermaurantiacus sp.]
MRIALYDMDRTITRTPSWMPWLLFWARAEAPWRLLLLPLIGVLLPAYPLLGRKRLKQAMQWLMMGPAVGAARVAARAEEFAVTFGRNAELPGALARMEQDRRDGFTIVIATASCRFYAAALAARWGADALIATENRVEAGVVGCEILGENCYGEAKRRAVLDWIGTRRVESMRFYSDHPSDLPTFLLADEPVAANPSPALAREARARGWPIVSWR